MNHPSSRPGTEASTADGALAAEASELADYFAGQNPLDAEAAVWVARRQDGLSAEEEAALRAWLAGDPARGAKLDQLTGVLGQIDRLPPDDVAALKAALPPECLPRRPERTTRPDTRATGHSQRLAGRPRWLPQTAMAALVIGGSWMVWNHWQQQPTFTQSLATQRGQQLTGGDLVVGAEAAGLICGQPSALFASSNDALSSRWPTPAVLPARAGQLGSTVRPRRTRTWSGR